MLKLDVRLEGFDRVDRWLVGLGKQQRFAMSRALNSAAWAGKMATEREIRAVFDRPTPWIQRSVRYVKSTRENLVSQIDFDAWGNKSGVTAAKVLRAEIEGGTRKLKRFELALARNGFLPAGMAVVPGPGAKLDQYGNLSSGQIVQVLSYLRAFGEQGYTANRSRRPGARRRSRVEYFSLRSARGKLVPGVYQRMGRNVMPVMFYVRIPRYDTRLDFYKVGRMAALEEFRRTYPGFLADALRTAR